MYIFTSNVEVRYSHIFFVLILASTLVCLFNKSVDPVHKDSITNQIDPDFEFN